ncbi:EpsI_fam, EpsI family protein [Comamonadaceae bacterium]
MSLNTKNLFLLVLMIAAATLGGVLRPSISMADERPAIDLEVMVPLQFGEWRAEAQQSGYVINPQQKSMLEKLYSQTLSRTYVDQRGYRIMLSIAYGKNQSDALSLHKPEVCYPAQGFKLHAKKDAVIELPGNTVNATRIETSLGSRFEPVTYWTVVGDQIVTSNINKKLVEINYSIQDRVPDGMLFRISSIDKNTSAAYSIQERFAKDIADAIDKKSRNRFIGSNT